MTSYVQRNLGTTLVYFLCLTDVAVLILFLHLFLKGFIVFYEVFFNNLVISSLFMLFTGLYRLVFHVWILEKPQITAGKGDQAKLNILLIGSVLLNLFGVFGGLRSYPVPVLLLLLLPSALAVAERFIYAASDESFWKPWVITDEDPSFDRQSFGTGFMMAMCIVDSLLMVAYYFVKMKKDVQYYYISVTKPFIIASAAFKLCCDLWVLGSPSLTVGKGDPFKLRIFLYVTVFLSVFPLLMMLIEYYRHFWACINPVQVFFALFFLLPPCLAAFQQFVYLTAEDSESCLKNWKPWKLHTEPVKESVKYARRPLGTAFVIFTCLLDFTFSQILIVIFGDFISYLEFFMGKYRVNFSGFLLSLMGLTGFYRLIFNVWMLFDPSLTAKTGDAMKLNVFVIGSLMLSFPWSVDMVISQRGNLDAYFVGFCLPMLAAIAERFIYAIPDSSSNVLRHLKPWEELDQEDPDYEKAI